MKRGGVKRGGMKMGRNEKERNEKGRDENVRTDLKCLYLNKLYSYGSEISGFFWNYIDFVGGKNPE